MCKAADKSFQIFWQRFKNDRSFQLSRISDPLLIREEHANEEPKIFKLSAQQLKASSFRVIDDKQAREQAKGEGALCESMPVFPSKRAEVGQRSCGTDVFSIGFVFIEREGCWYLESVFDSGG
jgi:hypothetical protein